MKEARSMFAGRGSIPRSAGSSIRNPWLVAALTTVAVLCIGLTSASARMVAAKPTLKIGDGLGGCGDLYPSSGSPESYLAYESLLHRKPDGTLLPGLATSWGVRPGNKVMTMTIRRDARYSD